MNEPLVDVAQLQRRDPVEWTALLSAVDGLEDVVVTAVTAQPLPSFVTTGRLTQRVTRYLLSLDGHSDAIALIGLRTTRTEALFYRDFAGKAAFVAPHCYLSHVNEAGGWVVMDDVPDHFPRPTWRLQDVEDVLGDLAALHAASWDQADALRRERDWLAHFVEPEARAYSWDELRREHAIYFEEGPGAVISDHAVQNAGRLAPRLLEAANGLVVMRELGGWPGVFGETHLTAVADLLDDPVPMLEPLLRLPATLLHGDPHPRHWRQTLFGTRYLLDWRNVTLGPAVCDLVSFQERFDLLLEADGRGVTFLRESSPASAETIIDSYLLAMNAELGPRFDARAFRRAIPAARCLHVILNWFPHFATWFDHMPNRYVWQRYNRMDDEQFIGTMLQPIAGIRPYLRELFRRFIQAYYML